MTSGCEPRSEGEDGMRYRLLVALCAGGMAASCYLIWTSGAQAVDHPDLFEVTSPDFPDNGLLSEANAGIGTSLRGPWACGGQNISPALTCPHPPPDTHTSATLMPDPTASRATAWPKAASWGGMSAEPTARRSCRPSEGR